ncbi:MAG: UDP-3-O-[3-hydroxymyristoyl] N-acetylglucosamine deacetylase [Planctomycetes bacterium]|nr:UDP-3-O-[3-hydroxymyristoyl] N-acetylglucosamine deacetylase [Planctomycetota bacterium]
MKESQKTIRRPLEFEGVGLHTGEYCHVRLKPAKPDTGIVFIRADLPDKPRIRAQIENLSPRLRRTSLRNGTAEVQTVEHLMATLCGLAIDNLEVEMTASEVPGADGSCKPFLDLIQDGEIEDLKVESIPVDLEEPVSVVEEDATVVALPAREGLTISYTLDYDVPSMKGQFISIKVTRDSFAREIAPARTFCLYSEVERLRAMGLGKGANYDNTLVVDEKGVINNTLRFPDEFVRHKVLDLIGDLYLLGRRLNAHVIATKSGHPANAGLVKQIVERKKAWESRAENQLDIREIQKILPHRFPFLLIDRIVEMDGYKKAVGIKNVTINEPFFMGHWPGRPVMPGVLQLEAMAQLAGVLLLRKVENDGKLAIMLSIDRVKFRKVVVPGDQLRLEAYTVRLKARTGKVNARAFVGNEQVAEAQFKFMLVDAD